MPAAALISLQQAFAWNERCRTTLGARDVLNVWHRAAKLAVGCQLNKARSRVRASIWRFVHIDQTCLGRVLRCLRSLMHATLGRVRYFNFILQAMLFR